MVVWLKDIQEQCSIRVKWTLTRWKRMLHKKFVVIPRPTGWFELMGRDCAETEAVSPREARHFQVAIIPKQKIL